MLELILIAAALAMDCFAVSVVCGVVVRGGRKGIMPRIAFDFGLFQALMPLPGWLLAHSFADKIEAYDHWVAFAMLAAIGGKMIYDSFHEDDEPSVNPERMGTRLLLAVATSIDAMAIGITFACTGYERMESLVLPLIVIGLFSFFLSIAGFLLGSRFGDAVNRKIKPELLGGIILVGIGIKILVEHLFFT